jgi:hypothetical protein
VVEGLERGGELTSVGFLQQPWKWDKEDKGDKGDKEEKAYDCVQMRVLTHPFMKNLHL